MRGLGKHACALLVATLAFAFGATPAAARDCSSLAGMKVAAGTVTEAAMVAAGKFEPPPSPFPPPPGVTGSPYASLPAFCRVQATLKPSADSDIKVEVWLPAAGWNGKYVGIGNGVWAGQLSLAQLADPLSRGYAVATTDTGHTGSGMSGDFAVGHPEKLIDFGYRAVHQMTLAAKQLVQAYYGKGPQFSLWDACSTGGRQGLMEAYRYPEDYDAISAKAPANPMTDLMVQSMWAGYFQFVSNEDRETATVSLAPPAGKHLGRSAKLTPQALALVHQAVVRQCDALDGLADGIIARPDACDFNPATLVCEAGASGDDCLTPGQVATVNAIYDGVRDGNGKRVLPGWPRGSEMQLAVLVSGPAPFPVALSYFQLLVHGDDPNWDWQAMDFGKELGLARAYGADMLNVPADGLGPFFARGGKLLLSHGWTDGLIPANNSVAFYDALYSALPTSEAQGQLRLFMVPGMDHCGGGEGASSYDTLGVIDAWASTGVAPSRITATRSGAGGFPGAPKLPPLSRPLCPYPLVPSYDGSGPEDKAESFGCKAAG